MAEIQKIGVDCDYCPKPASFRIFDKKAYSTIYLCEKHKKRFYPEEKADINISPIRLQNRGLFQTSSIAVASKKRIKANKLQRDPYTRYCMRLLGKILTSKMEGIPTIVHGRGKISCLMFDCSEFFGQKVKIYTAKNNRQNILFFENRDGFHLF